MREAVIVSTARTGIGKANRGYFNITEAPVIGAHVMNAAVERAGIDPARIDDVFYGAGNEWGTQGYNVARNTISAAGIKHLSQDSVESWARGQVVPKNSTLVVAGKFDLTAMSSLK